MVIVIVVVLCQKPYCSDLWMLASQSDGARLCCLVRTGQVQSRWCNDGISRSHHEMKKKADGSLNMVCCPEPNC